MEVEWDPTGRNQKIVLGAEIEVEHTKVDGLLRAGRQAPRSAVESVSRNKKGTE